MQQQCADYIKRQCAHYINRAYQFFSSVFLYITHFFQSFKKRWLFPEKWSFLFSQQDFVLRVSPISPKQTHQIIRNFPPPGYGTPPGKKAAGHQPQSAYGLFVYPAGLALRFIFVSSFLYFFILPGFLAWGFRILLGCNEGALCDTTQYPYLWLLMLGFTFFLLLLFLTYHMTISLLFKRKMPPIFSDVWKLWPESQYDLFLTVPHLVKITKKDKKLKNIHKYWRPDESTPISHQSSEYSQGMNTVQEVLLNLAIFELFFYNDESNKNKVSKNGDHSIRLNSWLVYYFSPVWISYFIIIIAILLYQIPLIREAVYTPAPIFNFPANIVAASFIWLGFSVRFIWKRIENLRLLHKDVKDGVYESHLDLVPQKILRSITQIPHEQQIMAGIEHIQKVFNIVQIVAFSNIMLMLEVLPSYTPVPTVKVLGL